jgi:hypothetical protein
MNRPDDMHMLAETLDEFLNGDAQPKSSCFVLLVADFGSRTDRVDCISNGKGPNVVAMLKQVLAAVEGQPDGMDLPGQVGTA